jgi:hypothetical protein
VPNGYAEERDQVYRASQFWGAIWQIGDTAYYFGAIGSVLVPLLIVGASVVAHKTCNEFGACLANHWRIF